MTANIQKILLPTDFGPSCHRAAEYAANLAKALGASVHLVHVIDAPPRTPHSWSQRQTMEAHDRRYHEGRRKLAALAADHLQHADRVTLEVRTGTPAEAVVDAAIDYGADLIVMSAPARNVVPRIRSVAERVLESAPCPVLQVRQSGAAQVHFGRRAA